MDIMQSLSIPQEQLRKLQNAELAAEIELETIYLD
jgi:hypothetical protein